MNDFESKHPRGNPKNKGGFTQKANTAPESALPATRILDQGEVERAIDIGFPPPQANNLEKVAAVVDAVLAGANTADSIAEALDVVGREGSYYGDAAGHLGLIETVPGETVKTYAVTGLGQKLYALDPVERAHAMGELAAATPGLQVYAEEGQVGLERYLAEIGLGESTVSRRAATVTSWQRTAANLNAFASATAAEMQGAADRSPLAAQHALEYRLARAEATKPAHPQAASCPTCGNMLPLSGICDFC